MVEKVPVQTIILSREGKRVVPEIGKPFKFTQEELKQLKADAPDSFRDTVVEAATAIPGQFETGGPAQGGNPDGTTTKPAMEKSKSKAVIQADEDL